MNHEAPEYVRTAHGWWMPLKFGSCSAPGTPTLLWHNARTLEHYAEQVGPRICIGEQWARYTRMVAYSGKILHDILCPHADTWVTPWEIDGDKGPLTAGLRVQLHAVNGSWLWVLRNRAPCGSWDAVWPD